MAILRRIGKGMAWLISHTVIPIVGLIVGIGIGWLFRRKPKPPPESPPFFEARPTFLGRWITFRRWMPLKKGGDPALPVRVEILENQEEDMDIDDTTDNTLDFVEDESPDPQPYPSWRPPPFWTRVLQTVIYKTDEEHMRKIVPVFIVLVAVISFVWIGFHNSWWGWFSHHPKTHLVENSHVVIPATQPTQPIDQNLRDLTDNQAVEISRLQKKDDALEADKAALKAELEATKAALAANAAKPATVLVQPATQPSPTNVAPATQPAVATNPAATRPAEATPATQPSPDKSRVAATQPINETTQELVRVNPPNAPEIPGKPRTVYRRSRPEDVLTRVWPPIEGPIWCAIKRSGGSTNFRVTGTNNLPSMHLTAGSAPLIAEGAATTTAWSWRITFANGSVSEGPGYQGNLVFKDSDGKLFTIPCFDFYVFAEDQGEILDMSKVPPPALPHVVTPQAPTTPPVTIPPPHAEVVPQPQPPVYPHKHEWEVEIQKRH